MQQQTAPADPICRRMQLLSGEQPDRRIAGGSGWWQVAAVGPNRLPDQGWKLHVSATICSAMAILEQVLAVLPAWDVHWKVTYSLADLEQLNHGTAGRSQVGKFLTIYPPDDDTAVRLAQALDQVLVELDGPVIPSDRPLRPGSLVHYRYGGFTAQEVATNESVIVPAIADPAGQLVPDQRHPWYYAPPWANDPFLAAGVVTIATQTPGPIGTRYKVRKALHQVGKGGVYLADDLSTAPARPCVLKEARRHTVTDRQGRDARDRLRHEHDLLLRLQDSPWTPAVYDLFEQGGNLFLALEFVAGQTLRAHVQALALRGERLPLADVQRMGLQLIELVGDFHQAGRVIGDLTPNNILLAPDGALRLIDLEMSVDEGVGGAPVEGWTPGYSRPLAERPWKGARVADDCYALGACLFYLATGMHPLLPEDGRPLVARQVAMLLALRPAAPAPLVRAISQLLDLDPAQRLSDLTVVRAGLAAPDAPPASPAPPAPPAPPAQVTAAQSLRLAGGIGDWLLTTQRHQPARDAAGHVQRPWPASALGQTSLPSNLHAGAAGAGLFLVDLYAATGQVRYLEAGQRAAQWCLDYADSPRAHPVPGLYFGHAGVSWLLQRLGAATSDDRYLHQALAYARRVDGMNCPQLDITHGLAGLGLLHLRLALASGEAYHWQRAQAVGDQLLARAQPAGDGCLWTVELDKPAAYYGFAHGAAGIGYYLLELAGATGAERYLQGAQQAAQTLLAAHTPVMQETGWTWTRLPGDTQSPWPHWCNGASGIGTFLIRLYGLTGSAPLLNAARKAAVCAYAGCQPTQAGLCHGIAGEGDFLLDMYQVLGETSYLAQARELGAHLEALGTVQAGPLLWFTDGTDQLDPDLMIGNSGVGEFFLRLARPKTDRVLMLPTTGRGR